MNNENMKSLIAANRKWVEEQYQLLGEREAKIKRLLAECDDIRSKLQPMEEWLMKYSDEKPEAKAEEGVDLSQIVHRTPASYRAMEEDGLRGDRLRDEVVRILEAAYPDSLYYREILNRLERSGYRIGGKDPGLNLIAHMTKDDRIERGEKRGMYRLAVKKGNGQEQEK